jgi:predicted enzyme related to lactoylglutathione lyase
MGYISVDNVDTHAGKVTAAGGAIFRPDIPNVGRFAVVGNPHGAGFVPVPPERRTATPRPCGSGCATHDRLA